MNALAEYNGTSITVGVIDSGVDTSHPDINSSIIGFKDFINYQDDMNPTDGIVGHDDNGHGTMVNWLIAGNGDGCNGSIHGVAPGASILATKALESFLHGQKEILALSIDFCVSKGVDIICLSPGVYWNSAIVDDSLKQAINSAITAGIIIVAASGNYGPELSTVSSPGAYPDVITVGAAMPNNHSAPFSSRGPVTSLLPSEMTWAKPDILAYGYDIIAGGWVNSTSNPPLGGEWGNLYTLFSGTSAATPQVAGALAIALEIKPNLTVSDAKLALMTSALDLDEDPMIQGAGLLDVDSMIDLISDSLSELIVAHPARLPCLPTTEELLIPSSVSSTLNVSIMSGSDRGTCNILCLGNASTYFSINHSTLDINKGTTLLEVGFNIPNEIQISSAGYYVGRIEIIKTDNIILEIPVEFTLDPFGGRVIVDDSHGISCG